MNHFNNGDTVRIEFVDKEDPNTAFYKNGETGTIVSTGWNLLVSFASQKDKKWYVEQRNAVIVRPINGIGPGAGPGARAEATQRELDRVQREQDEQLLRDLGVQA